MQHVFEVVLPDPIPAEQPAKEGNTHLVQHGEAAVSFAEGII
ncbi:hypothetical protein WME99_33690 [Sorangium sp. So ce136]